MMWVLLKDLICRATSHGCRNGKSCADTEEGPTGQWRVNGVALSDGVELEDGADSEGGADPDEEAFLAIPELGQPDQVMLAISIKGKTCLGMQHVSSKHANTDT